MCTEMVSDNNTQFFCCLLATILFDLIGIAVYIWYGFKGGGLLFAFPVLLLKLDTSGALRFVEENWKKGRDQEKDPGSPIKWFVK